MTVRNEDQPNDSANGPWCELATKHRANPNLDVNPLYSVPEDLIVAVKKEMPDLLTEDEIEFELDLGATTGGGFLYHVPFGYPPLGEQTYRGDPPQESQELDGRRRAADDDIRQLMHDQMRLDGASDMQIERFFDEKATLRDDITKCQASYAGWMVTAPEFRRERDKLRENLDSMIKDLGGFPDHPRSFFGEEQDFFELPSIDQELFAQYVTFLRRWGLEGFSTWDLPIPMGMEINQVLYQIGSQSGPTSDHNGLGLSDAGLLVFAPWCMLASDQFGMLRLAKRAWRFDCPKHVQGWLNDNDNWGADRYERMLRIFRYRNLALLRRYGKRRQWKECRLDLALASFLGTKEDTVKKTRLQLNKRLRTS